MIVQGVDIRKATMADLTTALAVLDDAASWAASTGRRAWDVGVFAWPDGRGVARIRQWIDDGTLYVIWVDDTAVGTFSLWDRDDMFWPGAADDSLYLHQFGVRRHAGGIGHQAIRWMIEECRRRDRLYLRLDCISENEGIRRYYEAEGFVHSAETMGYGIPLSLYEMRIDLKA
jgi:GNAT superfamily N-acetyltransferase